ncbi:MAG: glycosyltransferase [Cytophagales bacterium]|nr:MAG: glycosyltransferase [Cytophagales bacterium]TAF59718.1 MAG: glycosyltransferase [Cytophagales bacterium]
MSVKRLAFFSVFHPYRGGIAQYNEALLKAFSTHCEANAYTFSRQYPSLLFPGTSQLVPAESMRENSHIPRLLDTLNPFSWRSTAKEILASKPDALFLSYWMPFFGLSMGVLAREAHKAGIKVGAIMHNITPHEPSVMDKHLNQYFVNGLDFGVVMSKGVSEDFRRLAPQKPFILHPHPVYTHFGKKIAQEEARQHFGIPEDATVYLFFGLIRAYKGLDILLKAFAQMLQPQAHLLIAGECYEPLERYEKLIQECPNAQNIHFHAKYIPDSDVVTYFSAADVNVLPYRTATQSGVLSVAYHFDIPVIVTDVGGLREAVEPYQSGLVVNPNDESALKAAMEHFLTKPNYAQAIESFKMKYSWTELAAKILEAYN